MSDFELLEQALHEPVHAEEPSVVKLMVYLHTFEPEFKMVDAFQVRTLSLFFRHVTDPLVAHMHAFDAGVSCSLLGKHAQKSRFNIREIGAGQSCTAQCFQCAGARVRQQHFDMHA
jgi:hypothetical protein